jgi:hypothetical protein
MSSAFPSSDGASVDVDARPIHRFRPLVTERNRGVLEALLSPPNAIMITNAHGQCTLARLQDCQDALL